MGAGLAAGQDFNKGERGGACDKGRGLWGGGVAYSRGGSRGCSVWVWPMKEGAWPVAVGGAIPEWGLRVGRGLRKGACLPEVGGAKGTP